jgi:nucleotide-binding universal stress UspA family protein
MKTILVLIGGGDRDEVILRTALAAAVPLSAHMDILHVHVSAGIAAQYDEPVQFVVGSGIGDALDNLGSKAKTFSELAAKHVHEFCLASRIEICDTPTNRENVTANFREENDSTMERLILHARQSDLVVVGRARQTQGLSPNTLEDMTRKCGRPVLVAATAAPQTFTGTVMVCWNKSDNVVRAIDAATPILTKAKRIVFTSITNRSKPDTEALHDIARQFAEKGISTDVRVIPANNNEISGLLSVAAEDCRADLVVMGAYGHSQFRELIFGSRTEALIRDVDRPIFLMR